MIVCNIICTLFGIYFAYTSAAGLLKKRMTASAHALPTRRIAAIIAARNEEAVIGPLVESLLRQKYPRELFDVYVVPNNCTDRTEEVARAAGAKIIRCTVHVRAKADALRCAFDYLTHLETPYDAYCIFDADNLVDEMFFQAVNDIRAQGWHAAQGYRDSKNPYDHWISGSMSAFYWFMSRFYNESRARLGMSTALNGTGFMVSDELIRDMGFNTVTLGEDLEFSAQCALRGVKIGWMPDARIYDEQPNSFRDSAKQRRRWSSGTLHCLRLYAVQLFKKRGSHAFDMGMLFAGMLLNIVGLISGICAVSLFFQQAILNPQALPALLSAAAIGSAASYLAFCGACALIFFLEGKLRPRALPAILLFPVFMFTWMPINLLCFFTKQPKWEAIRHTSDHISIN